MNAISVKAYPLEKFDFYNWDTEITPSWDYETWLTKPMYREKWISFDCLAFDEERNRIYCGLARFNGDILYAFDLDKKIFYSLGYSKVADKYDAKFHKSLEIDEDGKLYGAIAAYHDINLQREAVGGAIICYDPKMDSFSKLCIPFQSAYIQSIALDRKRHVIYGFTLYPEIFFSYDIANNKLKTIGLIGSGFEMCQPHNPVIDADGNVWGTWGRTRAWHDYPGDKSLRLFKYCPEEDRMSWLPTGVYNKQFNRNEPINSAILGPDKNIYIGTKYGYLVRMNPKTAEVEFIAQPCNDKRLAAIAFGSDELLYGVGGEGRAQLFTFDILKNQLRNLGYLYDEELQTYAGKIHHIVVIDDKTIYAGENDNWARTSYLWECIIK